MTEDIYANPDLTKKVRFQKGAEEDRDTDVCDGIDNVRIYDNFYAEESKPPEKPEDNIAEDQQQTASVNASSEKRNVFRAAAVLLGLLCLLLLVAVIVLVVLYILERNRLWVENANLTSERDELRTSYSETMSLNANLTSERDKLRTSYSETMSLNVNLTSEREELRGFNVNLTLKMNQLEATNHNLTTERDELQDLLDERRCCPDKWKRLGNSCYLKSTSQKNWTESKMECIKYDAHLVIISSKEEQDFISLLMVHTWIGLTDEEHENVWKWVDGTPLIEPYWQGVQPDNANNEDCVEIVPPNQNSMIPYWNDLPCGLPRYFTCEKILE